MAFRACFYKGVHAGLPGIYNRVVQWWTNSIYSHMELQFSDGLSASASYMDGGVRFKQINYTTDTNWDFIDLPEWMEPDARKYFEDRVGWGYDLFGNLHFVWSPIRGAVRKIFCSEGGVEACGVAVGQGFRFSPADAFAMLSSRMLVQCGPTFVNVQFTKP
ncbi:hypothetical protein AB4Z19_15635 [Pseudoduganella sp. RAF19]|uniref:hypothetical protein n=1 Tax=Bacteria TaxID=2 RepID=UPI003F9AD662